MMNSCENCNHRTHDDRWGGPVCKVYNHSVRDVDKYLDCQEYEKKHSKEDDSSLSNSL